MRATFETWIIAPLAHAVFFDGEAIGLAALFGFVVLLALLEQAMMSVQWFAGARSGFPAVSLGRAVGLFAAAVASAETLDEGRVRALAVLSFGVLLRSFLMAVVLAH